MEKQLLLVQCLSTLTMDALKEIARDNFIKGYSSLRKKELVYYLTLQLLYEKRVKNVMIHAVSSEIAMLEKAMSGEVILSQKTCDISYWGARGLVFNTPDGKVHVPDDVAQLCQKILKNPEFEQKRKESELLERYCRAFANLYHVIPVKQCVDIINQQNSMDLTIPDFIQWEDQRYYVRNGFLFLNQDGYITADDFFVDDGPDYHELLRQQRDQLFYVPKRSELLKYAEVDYVEESEAYLELRQYLELGLRMEKDTASFVAMRMQLLLRKNYPMKTLLQELERAGIKMPDKSQLASLKTIISNLYFNSRLAVYRGHTPNELRKINPEAYQRIYGDVTCHESKVKKSEPAKMQPFPSEAIFLSDHSLKEKPMQRAEEKVYPNDSCPCGSGRKYKKCCGRK